VTTIKWSNGHSSSAASANGINNGGGMMENGATGSSTADALLAIGCQDGCILIWNMKL
jgi:hypothetical protein